jgi:ubiquinone biosynthesis monooxygenase Coq7
MARANRQIDERKSTEQYSQAFAATRHPPTKLVSYTLMSTRHLSKLDQVLASLDDGLRTVFASSPPPARSNPADTLPEGELSSAQRDLAAALMRVNHSGEVCAQALYRGQAVSAGEQLVRSYLNPLWYAGSFLIGAAAGSIGDKWSLGFVAETERQVVAHLDGHLERIPAHDQKSRAIIMQMREDEGRHATVAIEAGAARLPLPVQRLMRLTSKVMTRTAYWI